jgi:membrane protease YdiL (CAAX protease family)
LPPLALIALGRVSPAGLGLSVTPLAIPMAVVLSGFFVFAFIVSRASIRRRGVSPRIAAAVEKDYLTPRSDEELRWWWALSLQAGVVEELVYRGYLCWFFSRWMPVEWTLVPSSVMFGLGHLNQGVRRAIVTGVIGTWFGFVFVVSGSLLPGMAAHFTIDVVVGLLARLRREAALAAAPARA